MERVTQTSGQKTRSIVLAIVCSVLLIIAVNALVCRWIVVSQRPVVVMFDMKSTVDAFFESASKQTLSEEQNKALTERFTRALDDTLTEYQQTHRALILVAPAVVGGASDVTLDIQKTVAKRMRGESQ
ncbi:type-F conjugative transfer system protein TrbI [Yersinia aleksiciae]|uniref:type-F conjugative transfer system protein TrbI n=1 Tax=Yersinia aleksiciae TaxID=263819 RepID=UPI0005DE7178|nr:type-F conjugative transfer system protein TrbI [Yersinia aleksiciae]CNI65221.1 conjugative transfer protein [Yersinia frederiksenii]